eukprot:CAMPEP_0183772438 /NCGR_PEP_ID=MMETSP0739-20130205/35999_1 /TAXON_ID=385413 /ORGANISM="Thalassiosira miniscula, Strain CCMP1093" /LENGTH=89 /DNA_ID=CAMNT_0026013147 /DNA_START=102 /DNA_END=371 /DNA_ORIENTATION=-
MSSRLCISCNSRHDTTFTSPIEDDDDCFLSAASAVLLTMACMTPANFSKVHDKHEPTFSPPWSLSAVQPKNNAAQTSPVPVKCPASLGV